MKEKKIAESLLSGSFRDKGLKAFRALVENEENEEFDTAEETIATILVLRLGLEGTSDSEVQALLKDIDASSDFEQIGRAILFIPLHTYEAIIGNRYIDERKWWGYRKKADKIITEKQLMNALAHLAKTEIELRKLN